MLALELVRIRGRSHAVVVCLELVQLGLRVGRSVIAYRSRLHCIPLPHTCACRPMPSGNRTCDRHTIATLTVASAMRQSQVLR
jgi:hypothetical protein